MPATAVPARPAVPGARPVVPPKAGVAKVPAAAAPPAPVAVAAPIASAAPVSAAPVTAAVTTDAAPKKKRGRQKGSGAGKVAKVDYPALIAKDETGTVIMVMPEGETDVAKAVPQRLQLAEIPADYNPKLHNKLTGADFSDEAVYFDFRAEQMDKMAANFRRKALETRKLGNLVDRKNAKKLFSMQQKMAELVTLLSAQYKAQGMSDEEIAALLSPPAPETTVQAS